MALFIGLMSGTSLDGVDAALVDLADDRRPQLLSHHHQPWPPEFAARLRAVNGDTPLRMTLALDAELPDHYAGAVGALLARSGYDPATITAIGLHGQTVWHAPDATPPVTCQLGDPSRLAVATGIPVIADFRQADLAVGGEGAPLAPLFHAALFGGPQPRAVLNLGGIANLTFLGENATPLGGHDCGPANTLLDAWARRHLGQPFDQGGAWGARGQPDPKLLASLLADPYFARQPPKSTGPEYFNEAWLEARLDGDEAPADVQATLASLTAHSVAADIAAAGVALSELVVTGGGARNNDLLARLRAALPDLPVVTSDAAGYPVDAIEAMGFAWLAGAAMRGEALSLGPVTGARAPARLGGLYRP